MIEFGKLLLAVAAFVVASLAPTLEVLAKAPHGDEVWYRAGDSTLWVVAKTGSTTRSYYVSKASFQAHVEGVQLLLHFDPVPGSARLLTPTTTSILDEGGSRWSSPPDLGAAKTVLAHDLELFRRLAVSRTELDAVALAISLVLADPAPLAETKGALGRALSRLPTVARVRRFRTTITALREKNHDRHPAPETGDDRMPAAERRTASCTTDSAGALCLTPAAATITP